jgi:hypothetical protein
VFQKKPHCSVLNYKQPHCFYFKHVSQIIKNQKRRKRKIESLLFFELEKQGQQGEEEKERR